MRQPRRSTAAALTLSAALLLSTAACTGGDADDAAPTTDEVTAPTWPTAIDPTATTEQFWVVWTEVVETGAGDTTTLQPSIDSLAALGYPTLPLDPACQSGAEEQLAGLTGYGDPLGVGVAFGSAQDAGVFDTLYEGATVSITPGTYTCGTAS
ncbi:hypothetical protein [Cellulomonas sp. Root137]|uniref:hypothetical protein n=1 Tax=Cellulomonas sp. Root137 TaxID=1736459 RepID=UPI0006F517D4|nr:hypothetical protein [Cellulomonas sp. Root137]KQY47203.1 hypothetical protein ASD18_07515 [Cellulomonas sp. Root137]KRD44346.1 hypothetical protein ASE38_09420 [Cellulomonas sp. Root930]